MTDERVMKVVAPGERRRMRRKKGKRGKRGKRKEEDVSQGEKVRSGRV